MSINNIFTEPGVFSQFQPTTIFPVIAGGVRVAALVGTGRTTHLVPAETVTRGVSVDGTDPLANSATVLGPTITDENLKIYNLTSDYVLSSGAVSWSPHTAASLTGTIAGPYVGLSGTTFIVTVGGGSPEMFTFTTETTASQVAASLSTLSGISATVNLGAVEVSTTATNNTSLLIGDGTSNSILGFTVGSFQLSSQEPAAGVTYTVNYQYAKVTADYVPTFYFTMSDVIANYGSPDAVLSTLSLGAQIVFAQGASAICLIQVNPADGSTLNQFKMAIDKLAAVSGINIVVPLSNDISLHSYLKAHVDTASSITERKERTAIVSLPQTTIAALTGDANALFDKRMVLINSYNVSYFIGNNTTATVLDGSYVAAAIAGVRTSAAFDVADPLTHKTLAGFSGMTDTLLRQQKLQLLSNGVMVVENVGGNIRVLQQVTTDTSTRENNEYSVVEIIDFVASNSRQILENIFIGQKILVGTPSQVKSTQSSVLTNLVTSEIITAFRNVQATVDNIDPTQIDVSFEIAPVFPLNYILITFSLSPTA